MWDQVLRTLQHEFSDVPDVEQLTRIVLRFVLAVVLGALIGYDRERAESTAGLRTHMLVALGTAMFVLVSQQAGLDAEGMSRVIQGLLAGIGFLGAGAVIKLSETGQVRGLTTAAGLWSTAAIGMTVGLGREMTAVIATLFVLAILALVLRWEHYAELKQGARRNEHATTED
ncbi:MgtC/SapB family protein [Piscinibacter koreensis]|uniref:Protein MgtC n=1 Tax=Piscinibacter koreensis TaxID=2742824 RepID=A0A7Y6NQ56_9BURK|nr:MgtC/SapB family protein [Schlegelella koreensis]NUZ07241.1 MgtC/SapB family protein [Schlegelella koreensis]